MSQLQVAECALAALKAAHRDMSWLVATLHKVLDGEDIFQRLLTEEAAYIREVMSQHIATLEPSVVAVALTQRDEGRRRCARALT